MRGKCQYWWEWGVFIPQGLWSRSYDRTGSLLGWAFLDSTTKIVNLEVSFCLFQCLVFWSKVRVYLMFTGIPWNKELTCGSVNEQITIPNRKSCALSEIYHKVIKNFNANGDCFNISGKNRYSLLTWKLNTKCVFLSWSINWDLQLSKLNLNRVLYIACRLQKG